MYTHGADKRERYLFYNSLAILLKAVEGERTTVDLRNEASAYGIVDQADGFMNVVMKDCVFTDPRGYSFNYELFFIQARNIRYVHIPAHIRIIPSIKEQLSKLSYNPDKRLSRPTFKSKRAEANQAKGLAAVKSILEKKESSDNAKPGTSGI